MGKKGGKERLARCVERPLRCGCAEAVLRVAPLGIRVRSATAVICGVIVALDSSEP